MKIELESTWEYSKQQYAEFRINKYYACCVIKTETGLVYVMDCDDGNNVYSYIGGADFPLMKLSEKEERQILESAKKHFREYYGVSDETSSKKDPLDSLFEEYSNILFFDTETTGLSAEKGDRVIEYAAMQVTEDTARTEDIFVKLPKGVTISDYIMDLTGITNKLLKAKGVPEIECARTFSEMIAGKTLVVAYNAPFDLSFMEDMLKRYQDEHGEWVHSFKNCDCLDPLTIFRDRREGRHRLSDAITAYDLDGMVKNTHRAIDDVKALYEVTKALATEKNDLKYYIKDSEGNLKHTIPEKEKEPKTKTLPARKKHACR